MRVGVFLEAGLSGAEVAELGQLAEGLGIDTLWASSFPANRDPFLSLVPLATASSTLRLGVVPVSPYEVHPVRIADALLTLNELSGGRASILIGGLGKSVMRVTGLEPLRRVTAVRECVEIIRGAATGGPVNFDGQIFKALDYQAAWTVTIPPAVYVGATGPQMLKMAGQVADGVMMSDAPLFRMEEIVGNLSQGLSDVGRSPQEFRINNFFAWHIKKDRRASFSEARRELVWRGVLKKWYTAPFLGDEDAEFVESNFAAFLKAFLQRTDVIEGVPDRIVDQLVEHLTFAGDLDDLGRVVQHVKDFQAAGLEEITLKVHGDAAAAIHMIGEHLVPAVD